MIRSDFTLRYGFGSAREDAAARGVAAALVELGVAASGSPQLAS